MERWKRPFSSGSIPLHRYVERGDDVTQMRLKSSPGVMTHLFAVPDGGQHGAGRLHDHAHVPLPTTTQFHVGRDAFGPLKAGVGQHHHLAVVIVEQGQEGLVMDVIWSWTLAVAQSQSVISQGLFKVLEKYEDWGVEVVGDDRYHVVA